MPRYAMLIDYDGQPFNGWQRQAPGQPTVQGAIEAALARLDPGQPVVQAAGRTDAGVHATGQVAHCDLSRDWDTFRLAGAINQHLRPDPVAILAIALVPDDFHARFSANERRYLMRVVARRAPLTQERGRVWRVPGLLDVHAMQAGARHLLGRHDFTTFRSANCQAASPVKTLDEITVEQLPVPGGVEYRFSLRARSFLHNQVRSMVGTLVQVGTGVREADDVARALAACDRAACGPVSPPDGLYLTGVGYATDPFAADHAAMQGGTC